MQRATDLLQADSELLQEVMAYLLRLPAVPTTVALARKVKDHLDQPDRKAAELRASEEARRAGLRHGCNFTPVGLPVIEAEVDGDHLRLWTPGDAVRGSDRTRAGWPVMLCQRLQSVETVVLHQGAAKYMDANHAQEL